MTEGIIQKVFNEWTDSIRGYMKEQKKIESDKVTDLDYKIMFNVIAMRERQLIAEIEKKYTKSDIVFCYELIGNSEEKKE